MAISKDNPYEPPRAVSPSLEARGLPWFYGAVLHSILGSLVAAGAIYFIYVDDPRTGTRHGPSLSTAVIGAAVICGFGWFIVGAITGLNIKRMLVAHAVGVAAVITWVVIGGTYSDVVGAATVVGWPLGGAAGALHSRGFSRFIVNRIRGGELEAGKS